MLINTASPPGVSLSESDPMSTLRDGLLLPQVEVTGMSFTQSIEAPLTVRDTATMSGENLPLSPHNVR